MDAIAALNGLTVEGLPAASGTELSEGQATRLRRVYELHDRSGGGTIGEEQLLDVLADLGLRPDLHADERAAIDEMIANLRTANATSCSDEEHGSHGEAEETAELSAGPQTRVRARNERSNSLQLSEAKFLQLMRTQRFIPGESGRFWVALSLREAESLRGAMHVSMDLGIPLVANGCFTPPSNPRRRPFHRVCSVEQLVLDCKPAVIHVVAGGLLLVCVLRESSSTPLDLPPS